MPGDGVLDSLPLWAGFAGTLLLVLLSVEGGYCLGRYRHKCSEQEKEAPVGAMVGATLGLLGFLLAFTFGSASARFDTSRQMVLEEANAIGTTYLRAGLLSEPHRTQVRKLLREYVDVRLEAVRSNKVEQAARRSEELHGLHWEQAVAVAEKNPDSIAAGLFIQSLNGLIDVHSKRVAVGLRSRLPGTIWIALYAVAILAMATMGYHSGLDGTRRSFAILPVAFIFSTVLWLIADLDRPQEGWLEVSQQAMIDLRNSMTNPGS
jgi:hypothetical protein